ncbi:hypothetical protein GJ496_011526 [Pomphorhynchus laevis]|nr:hypothetical protein GJ496_011526 [Pomphorhynchus laevis]
MCCTIQLKFPEFRYPIGGLCMVCLLVARISENAKSNKRWSHAKRFDDLLESLSNTSEFRFSEKNEDTVIFIGIDIYNDLNSMIWTHGIEWFDYLLDSLSNTSEFRFTDFACSLLAPIKIKLLLIRNEFIRARKICYEQSQHTECIKALRNEFMSKGYVKSVIDRQIMEVEQMFRIDLIVKRVRNESESVIYAIFLKEN